VGVAAHPDCPIDKYFYFHPKRFPRKQWGVLSDKFLTHGYAGGDSAEQRRYRGSGLATAYLSGTAACLAEVIGKRNAPELIKILKRSALVPVPEIGYS